MGMKNLRTFTILIVYLLIIISGCNHLSISPENPKDTIPYKTTPDKADNNGFAIVKSTSTPCWLQSPKNCEKYQQTADIYVSTYINLLQTENINEDKINKQLYRDYLIILKNEILKKMKYDIIECEGKLAICKEIYIQYFMNQEPAGLKDKFVYIDTYRSLLNDNQSEYYVLGMLKDQTHQRLMNTIINYIRNNVPRAYEPVNNPDIKWLE